MDGLYPENDPPVELGPDGDEQQGATESNSLFDGSGCDSTTDVDMLLDDVLFGGGTNELDSLFGDDAEMQSLLARLEGEEPRQQDQHQHQQQDLTFPLSFPADLAFLPLPLSPSALLQTDNSAGSLSAVSTLQFDAPQNQQQNEQQVSGQEEAVTMSRLDFGLDGCPDVNLDFDLDFDFGLAVEQGVAKQTQGGQETGQAQRGTEKEVVTSPSGHQNAVTITPNTFTSLTSFTPAPDTADGDGRSSPIQAQPRIDNPSSTTDIGSRDDQEGPGPAIINIDDDVDSDDDVVLLSSRPVEVQVQEFVSTPPPPPPPPASLPGPIPHYLELRPRCPQGPPPSRIDLDSFNVEELLPFVQLYAKLSLDNFQERLGLDVDSWKLILPMCREHLADPAHAITLGGSGAVALRATKVALIHSALALLKDSDGRAGVGSSWFGRESTLEPKSEHVWPEDSTTLTILFIQLLYRLTRNASSRKRYRKANTEPPSPMSGEPNQPNQPKASETSTSPEEDQLEGSNEAPTEPRPRKRKRKTPQPRRAPKPVEPPIPMAVQGKPRSAFGYSSPSVLREALLATTTSSSAASVSESEKAVSPTLTAPSPATAFAEQAYHHYYGVRRAPANASICYRVNVIESHSQKRAVPQIVLDHEGDIRAAGYSYLTGMCSQLGRTVESVSIMTILGLERVVSDLDWDRVINRVNEDDLMMDGEVKILVRLLD